MLLQAPHQQKPSDNDGQLPSLQDVISGMEAEEIVEPTDQVPDSFNNDARMFSFSPNIQ